MEAPELKSLQDAAAAIQESNNSLAGLLKKQDEEIKAYGRSTEETAAKIQKMEESWDQAKADVAGLKTLIGEVEKKFQRGNLGFSDSGGEQRKSLGSLFVEALEKEKSQVEAAFNRRTVSGTPSVESKSIWTPENMERKTLSTTETTNFDQPYQIPTIFPMTRRSLRLRDLMTVIPTTAPSVRYIRETGFMPATALSVSSITSVSTVATVTTASAHGYRTRDRVRISGATQTEYNGDYSITVLSSTTFKYTFAGSGTSPATGTILANRLNNWGAADFVAEGGDKPQAQLAFTEVLDPVEVIAHWLPATRQVFADLPGLRSLVDDRLLYGLRRKEDSALLYANGSGGQIQGIIGLAGVQSYSWSNGTFGDTMIDAIRRAATITQIVEQEDPTGVVMHPSDWETIELTKSSTNEYILVNSPLPGTDPMAARIWRVPVVVTPAINQGTAVQGPWGTAAAIYDREQANVRFSDQHSDFFTKNMVAVLAEERMMAAWYRPEAFVTITFDKTPDAP